MHQNSLSARALPQPHRGSLQCSPEPLVSWGGELQRGTPLPIPIFLDAFHNSISVPMASRSVTPPPNKIPGYTYDLVSFVIDEIDPVKECIRQLKHHFYYRDIHYCII